MPFSISARISPSVLIIRSASAFGIMPCLPSIAACAILPVMSSRYMRLSKEIDEWKWSVKLSVDCVKRPPQSFAFSIKTILSFVIKNLGLCPNPSAF